MYIFTYPVPYLSLNILTKYPVQLRPIYRVKRQCALHTVIRLNQSPFSLINFPLYHKIYAIRPYRLASRNIQTFPQRANRPKPPLSRSHIIPPEIRALEIPQSVSLRDPKLPIIAMPCPVKNHPKPNRSPFAPCLNKRKISQDQSSRPL